LLIFYLNHLFPAENIMYTSILTKDALLELGSLLWPSELHSTWCTGRAKISVILYQINYGSTAQWKWYRIDHTHKKIRTQYLFSRFIFSKNLILCWLNSHYRELFHVHLSRHPFKSLNNLMVSFILSSSCERKWLSQSTGHLGE
jgi:hypothetical protein